MNSSNWVNKVFYSLFGLALSLCEMEGQVKKMKPFESEGYRGVILNKTTTSEILKLFGEPTSRYRMPGMDGVVEFLYTVKERRNDLYIYFNNGVVDSLIEYPTNLTVETAIAKFGPNPKRNRYSFDDCLSDGGDAPLFKDPKGQFEYLEYPSKQMYLQLKQNSDLVHIIILSTHPPGSPASRCPPSK